MRTYNIISPSLDGILTDDHLYFEGIRKPIIINKIRDGANIDKDGIDVLEKYFNDIYNLFLRKLSAFASLENSTNEDITKLQALLQELIKVKNLINGNSKSESESLL